MDDLSAYGWRFIDAEGTFDLPDPEKTGGLYLPLANPAGMFSCVTPKFHGDAKTDQNAFLLTPVSAEDLHVSRAARNFWALVDGRPWSATGNSAEQIVRGDREVRLRAGTLWQTVTRLHPAADLQAEVTSFVPTGEDRVELMRVSFHNRGVVPISLTPTAAIPIFARSADNLRDHRHVTSLLHRTVCHRHGVVVRPTLSFDERGHTVNRLRYAVLGAGADGTPPVGFFPRLEDFIGEGGTLDWPRAVVENRPPAQTEGPAPAGYEAIGALRFADRTILPGGSVEYVLVLAILDEDDDPGRLVSRYASIERFEYWLTETQAFWSRRRDALRFDTGDSEFDGWLQWVSIQPILRRWMGNSFLPHHDYGRGGRGWRDLWQDAMALLLTDDGGLADMLRANFAGVRMDGSNATILGSRPGDFKADRNNIPRVWMDHGAWPLLTVRQYLDWTGDLGFLLLDQTYFKDHLTHRSAKTDPEWKPGQGTLQKAESGEAVRGSLLEHMLVQHLTAFHNVGAHNVLRLEGADWNDALDMAAENGESAAFSALYAGNLRTLAGFCRVLDREGVAELALAEELAELLGPMDYSSIGEKHRRLDAYFDRIAHTVSGRKRSVGALALAADLEEKSDWLSAHLRAQEWMTDGDGYGRFNGYYDNDGRRVEGDFPSGPRMTLTGQVFALMGGVATGEQAREAVRSARHYLFDETVGGYRLNTDFGPVEGMLGRAFGFAFGHKENGAMFSHMAVMFANALYRCGMADEGWRVLRGLFDHCRDFPRSRMYPGLPEYVDPYGRGMYPFLTGSASWYLLTLLTEAYGVKGRLGNLVLAPRFTGPQWPETNTLCLRTAFAGRIIDIAYRKHGRRAGPANTISAAELNGKPLDVGPDAAEIVFPRAEMAEWPNPTRIVVRLG